MQTIPWVAAAMQMILVQQADLAGHQTGFVQRASNVTGSMFTQRLVFGLLAHSHTT